MPSATIVTVPCDGAVLDVTVSPTPRSLARTDGAFSALPAGVVATSLTALGFTTIDTVAVLV